MAVEVFIHKMSEHMEAARIVRWLAQEGERVERRQVIMEVETDKAVAELEAPASGILKGIRAGATEGAEVPVGEAIAFIAAPDEAVPVLPQLGQDLGQRSAPAPSPGASPSSLAEPVPVRATPVARRVANELGIDLALVRGTGPDGRIKEEDVRASAAAQAASRREPVQEAVEWADRTPFQRLTGQRMLESLQTAPQFALSVNADMTHALRVREVLMDRAVAETGERLSITAILVKVVAVALRRHPRANASFEGGRIKLYRQANIGVAVGADEGLVVPVIREADRKPLIEIARQLTAFLEQARQMRFSPEDLSDGTFTLSNLGMYGIERFNAIINPPQSAILAVGRIVKTPVGLPDDTIVLLPLMNLTLTVDHRVMDGVQAARFLGDLKELLERPDFLM